MREPLASIPYGNFGYLCVLYLKNPGLEAFEASFKKKSQKQKILYAPVWGVKNGPAFLTAPKKSFAKPRSREKKARELGLEPLPSFGAIYKNL